MLLIRGISLTVALTVLGLAVAGCSNPKEIDYAAVSNSAAKKKAAKPIPTPAPTPNQDAAAGLVTRFYRDEAAGSQSSIADLQSVVTADFLRNHQSDFVVDYAFIVDPKVQIQTIHGRYVKYMLDYTYAGTQGLKLYWQRTGRWILNHGSAVGWVLDSDVWDSVHLVGISTVSVPTMLAVSDTVFPDGRHEFDYLGKRFSFHANGNQWAVTPIAEPTANERVAQYETGAATSDTPDANATDDYPTQEPTVDPPASSDASEETHFADSQSAQVRCPSEVVVWVNTRTGVFHLPGERWYGMTREGTYECESDAVAEGDRETRNGQ
jgi:hypothetical protein